MIAIQDLYWATLAGLVILVWWQGLQARDRAAGWARNYCRKMNLQWLDQTLVRVKTRFRKAGDNGWKLHSEYRFEFTTTGAQRYQGRVLVIGGRLYQIQTEAYEALDPEEELPEYRKPVSGCRR